MTSERELNTIIKNTLLNNGGWASKIADPQGKAVYTSIQNPFDGFGVIGNTPVYWEAKYMNKLASFNLQRIENHQISNLCRIQELLTNSVCCIILGVKLSRNENRIYVFKDIIDINERRNNSQNFLKKELESLPYFKVKAGIIQDFVL